MIRRLTIPLLTLLALAALDLGVAVALAATEGRIAALAPLAVYFERGRSVPGKLERWVETPGARGNLFDTAWRSEMVTRSAERFAAEPPEEGRVVRGYGMSFSNQILEAAQEIDPSLRLDLHAGPSAPPGYALAAFLDDRGQRRAGDVAVLGLLSWSAPAILAMSNRTWLFEQPAPFTYPVFRLEGEGLRRVEPLVETPEEERAAMRDPALAAAWAAQLRREDGFWTAEAFDLPALDASPFARLVRRALAIGAIDRRRAAMVEGDGAWAFEHAETLRRMIGAFARTAREDGQIPVVLLIQGRDPADPDLAATARAALEADDIPYVATVDHQNPRDISAFEGDGHYRPAANERFAQAFLALLTEKRP